MVIARSLPRSRTPTRVADSEPEGLAGAVELGDGAAERLRDYGYSYMEIFGADLASAMAGALTANTAEAVAEVVTTLDELGCDELFLVPTTADPAELARTRDALGL